MVRDATALGSGDVEEFVAVEHRRAEVGEGGFGGVGRGSLLGDERCLSVEKRERLGAFIGPGRPAENNPVGAVDSGFRVCRARLSNNSARQGLRSILGEVSVQQNKGLQGMRRDRAFGTMQPANPLKICLWIGTEMV